MMKTRKDFPTALKYRFYVLSQNFPQYFQQPRHQFLKQLPSQSFIQHNDVQEAKLPQFQKIGISIVKNSSINVQNDSWVLQEDSSSIIDVKNFVYNMDKTKPIQKQQKHFNYNVVEDSQGNQNQKKRNVIKQKQKREQSESMKVELKKQQKSKSREDDLSSDEEQRRKLKQKAKISTKRLQNSMMMPISQSNSAQNISNRSVQLSKQMSKKSQKQQDSFQKSQISVSLNQSMGSNQHNENKTAQNKQVIETDYLKKQQHCKRLPSFQIKQQNKQISSKESNIYQIENMDQKFPVKQDQNKDSEENFQQSSLKQNQKQIQVFEQFENNTPIKTLVKNQIFQSDVKQKSGQEQKKKSLFQQEDKIQIKRFFPSIQNEKEQRQIFKQQVVQKDHQAELSQAQKKSIQNSDQIQKFVVKQQDSINKSPKSDIEQDNDLEIKNTINQNEENQIKTEQRSEEKSQICIEKKQISQKPKNKLVERFLGEFKRESGRGWFDQIKSQGKNKKQQQYQQKIQNCNKLIQKLKNQVGQSYSLIKDTLSCLSQIKNRVQKIQQKNRDLEQANIENTAKIERLQKKNLDLVKQSELDRKQIQQLKLKFENYQKVGLSDRELMRQKMQVLEVQLGRQTIKLGDIMAMNEETSKTGILKKKSN